MVYPIESISNTSPFMRTKNYARDEIGTYSNTEAEAECILVTLDGRTALFFLLVWDNKQEIGESVFLS